MALPLAPSRHQTLRATFDWSYELLAEPERTILRRQLRALWGLWVDRMTSGQFGVALSLAQQFHRLAAQRTDAADLPIADRMIGVSLHYRGDQTAARHHIDRMLTGYVAPVPRIAGVSPSCCASRVNS